MCEGGGRGGVGGRLAIGHENAVGKWARRRKGELGAGERASSMCVCGCICREGGVLGGHRRRRLAITAVFSEKSNGQGVVKVNAGAGPVMGCARFSLGRQAPARREL